MKKSREQKTLSRKRKTIALALIAALVLVIGGALALFTSRTTSDFEAKAGTVILEVAKLNLTNKTNVNPGDMDPDNLTVNENGEAEYTHGTPHEFSYELFNTGNKSVRTKQTILITADKAGESIDTLDARVFKLFVHGTQDELFMNEIIDPQTGCIIQGRYYVMSNDTELKTLEDVKAAEDADPSLFVKAVKYTFMGNIYDGCGTSTLLGGDAEKESQDGLMSVTPNVQLVQQDANGEVKESFLFDFGMMRTATNKYQGCDINIEVIAEAVQYRNTNDTDWALASQVKRSFTTAAVQQNVVPATNENKWGDELYAQENQKQKEYEESLKNQPSAEPPQAETPKPQEPKSSEAPSGTDLPEQTAAPEKPEAPSGTKVPQETDKQQ